LITACLCSLFFKIEVKKSGFTINCIVSPRSETARVLMLVVMCLGKPESRCPKNGSLRKSSTVEKDISSCVRAINSASVKGNLA